MANVYTSLSNALWYTDKCEVATTSTPVTYQVYATALGSEPAAGNIYSGPPEIGTNQVHQFYVGVGNYVTVSGTGYTATEIGGQTSAQAGVGNFVENLTPPEPPPVLVLGSAEFDGDNYLSTTGGAGTAMGTGDFTWECWVRPTASLGYQTFIDTRGVQTGYSETNDDGAYFGLDTDTLYPVYYQAGPLVVSSRAVTQDEWTHVALVRNSGTTTLYVGGVSGGTYSDSIDFTAPYVNIGSTFNDPDLGLTGQISNIRMVKGTAVYTEDFTPPTVPLTAISGTQLLLNTPNDANFLVDSSTNNFTVTNNGAVTSSELNPFVPALILFTSVGSTTWTAPPSVSSVQYLVVGGGGGGGTGYDSGGGGGGAGGMVLTGTLAVTPGTTYTVTVGAGGAGGPDERINISGNPGSDSVFASVTALGGSAGQGSRIFTPTARYTGGAAQVDASAAPLGGGGGGGGDAGGGGGGATGPGGTRVSASSAGVGGAGTVLSITGSSVTYSAGGAGGTANVNNNDGAAGANNTGTGGGAGSATGANSGAGGNGGSGVVVLQYGLPYPSYTWYEAFGTTAAISTTQYVGATKIYAESSTYDVPDFQPAVVAVNDVEIVNTELRGHTMVVLTPDGTTVSIANYDTYIDPANVTALAAALNAVASGNIVVLVVYDASALDAAVRSAINTGYGSTNTETWTPERISHILVGIKS